jgi:hypothetical protein
MTSISGNRSITATQCRHRPYRDGLLTAAGVNRAFDGGWLETREIHGLSLELTDEKHPGIGIQQKSHVVR